MIVMPPPMTVSAQLMSWCSSTDEVPKSTRSPTALLARISICEANVTQCPSSESCPMGDVKVVAPPVLTDSSENGTVRRPGPTLVFEPTIADGCTRTLNLAPRLKSCSATAWRVRGLPMHITDSSSFEANILR